MERYTVDYTPPKLKSTNFGIAYVGCGGIARAHARAAQSLGLNLVACCDVVEDAAKRFAQEFGVPRHFTDYRSMLESTEIDVVEVAIPPHGRVDVVTAAAEAGKHINIEKPFAHAFADALRMTRIAERAGVFLAVSQNTRYYPGARAAYELIRAGVLGDVFYLDVRMFGNQDRTNTKWYRTVDNFLLVEWGSHHFDIARFWAGTPRRVCCQSRRVPGQGFASDMVQVSVIDFESGALGVIAATDASASDTYDYPIRIEGTKASLRGSIHGPVEICLSDNRREWIEVDLAPFREGPDPIACLLAELLNGIIDGRPSGQSAYDNLLTVAAYSAAVRSRDEGGRWVGLDEFEIPPQAREPAGREPA